MKFSEFVKKADQFYKVVKVGAKRVDTLCGVKLEDLTYLPWWTLKEVIPDLFKSHEFERAIYLILREKKKSITFGKVKRANNYKKYGFILWVQDQYARIDLMEKEYLFTIPDPKLMAAGIRELDVLGYTNLVDNLAGGDILKWEQVKELPYSMVFDKQLKSTIENRISKKLSEQRKAEQKAKNKRRR